MINRNITHRRSRQSHRAFTVIEMMVALGILAILLVIIVLPLRLAFDSFNAGNARSGTQSSLDSTMTQFETDLRQAVYVFPNAPVAGVTNQAPYGNQLPYYLSTDKTQTGEPGGDPTVATGNACAGSANVTPWSNPSTISMIQVRRDDNGNVLTPLAPSYNIVTYYARRQQLGQPYDPIDNPVVMYRAEYPAFGLKTSDGSPAPLMLSNPTAGAFSAPIKDFSNSVDCTTPAIGNRSSLWLSFNVYGEADLLPLTKITQADVAAGFDITKQQASYSQTLAIPRGLALQTSNAYRIAKGQFAPLVASQPAAPLVPDTTFTCADTNKDGKIDRVTISLALASFNVGAQGKFDTTTQQPAGTVLRATRTVNLPNIQ